MLLCQNDDIQSAVAYVMYMLPTRGGLSKKKGPKRLYLLISQRKP